ncbi:MAG: hypothetical protein LC104_04475 [Bacteroidales bacterium]|nr:hypothetical protein [Bacteroidales bacterium]
MIRFAVCMIGVVCGLGHAVVSGAEPLDPQVDPQVDRPYDWRIVMVCQPHPLWNAAFRERLARDIQTALQPAVGEQARVNVCDLAAIPPAQWEPAWIAFEKQGWKSLEWANPQQPRTLTGVKTHFLFLAMHGRTVRLEARQLDGDTGLLSPVLRRRETNTLDTVGRLAGLMLGADFGAVGTVIAIGPRNDWVRLQLRGAACRSPYENPRPLVERGDIFAVATVLGNTTHSARPVYSVQPSTENASPPPLRAALRSFTLLRATESPSANGTVKCDVLTQYVTPFPQLPGVLGFRALKLATVTAPLQVRVVDAQGQPPAANLLIRVRAVDSDFGVRPNPRDYLISQDGVFHSERPFQQVACVSVGLGGTQGERRYPLPILEDGVPHVVSYSVSAAEIARAAFERKCEELRSRIAEARVAERILYEGLFKLITDGKNQEALDRAAAGLQRFQEADRQLTQQLQHLQAEPHAQEPLPAALLGSADTLLLALRNSLPPLAERVDDLKQAVAKAKDPTRFEKEFRAKEMIAQIRQHLEFGEVPEALALYDALFTLTQQADVKTQRDTLAKAWQPQGPDHTPAREFFTTNWRAASTVAEYLAALPKLKESAAVLQKYNDQHGLRLLLTALEPAHARLKQMANGLDADSDVDRPQLQNIQAVVNVLLEVEAAARGKLKTLTEPQP